MKWFKHDSNAIKDEKIQFLMNEHGAQAYTIYFGVCELCAEKLDRNLKPEIRIGWLFVEQLTHCKRSTIRKVLGSCAVANLLLWEQNDKLMICSIPNLLKRLDNWTSDLVVANKKLPIEQEVRSIEQEVKNKSGRFAPPTQEEVSSYFTETLKASKDQAVSFFQFYGSKDWFVGKNRMKNWHLAAARSLEWAAKTAPIVAEKKEAKYKLVKCQHCSIEFSEPRIEAHEISCGEQQKELV